MGTGGVFLRRARANFTDHPTGFIWVEKDNIAASGYPASRNQLRWISEQGITEILTLTEDPIPEAWAAGLPLSLMHVPMADHEPPSQQDLEKAVEFVESRVRAGKKVLVHCLAGQGRTMSVLAAYLIKERGIKPEEALKTLRAMRPGAVERSQESAVFGYAKSLMGSQTD